MDSLTNVSSVLSALAQYKKSIGVLNETITSLETNKSAFNAAYQSSNADDLQLKYEKLISNLSAAYASLTSYQAKIDGVVAEIIGFDETLQSGE